MKNFRWIKWAAAGLLVVAALWSCSKDDDPTPVKLGFTPVTDVTGVAFNGNTMNVLADGVSVTVPLTDANGGALAQLGLKAAVTGNTIQEDWCTAKVEGSALKLTVGPNTDKSKNRSVKVTVSSDLSYVTPVELNVVQSAAPKATGAQMLSFSLEEQTGPAVIDEENQTVTIEVAYGTDTTALVPTIVVSEGAVVSPESGKATDFTNPVVYTVTSEDGENSVAYTVMVTTAKNHEAKILSFTYEGFEGVIDEENKTISVEVPYGTAMDWVDIEYTASDGAKVEDPGLLADYSDPQIFTVTAADGTEVKYTVTVTVLPNTATDILFFDIPEAVKTSIDQEARTITVNMPQGANVSALVPEITLSDNATVSPASGEAQNFSSPVVYTVTAEDGKTTGEYTVSVAYMAPIVLDMVDVTAGTFTYGDNPAFPQEYKHAVTLTKNFAIGKYEVTQELFQQVMGYNPASVTTDPQHFAVDRVSWYDAALFCNKLSLLNGLTPAYKFEQVKYRDGRITEAIVTCDHATATGYRLPTSAEWEYAAKGGNQSGGYIYAGSNDPDEVAWYKENSLNAGSSYETHPSPVGGKKANELGLYDMSGGVDEWCYDWSWGYGKEPTEPETDPVGASGPTGIPTWEDSKVFRGGSHSSAKENLYTSYTRKGAVNNTNSGVGFRIVVTQ